MPQFDIPSIVFLRFTKKKNSIYWERENIFSFINLSSLIHYLQIGTLEGFYHLEHAELPHRSRRSADERTERLTQDPKVRFAI